MKRALSLLLALLPVAALQAAGSGNITVLTDSYSGIPTQPANAAIVAVQARIASVNTFTTGTTLLLTVPTSRTFVPTRVVITVTAASGVTAGPTVNIYTASAGDIIASTALTNLKTAGQMFHLTNAGSLSTTVAAGSSVYIGITTASTGTSQTVRVELLGYFE